MVCRDVDIGYVRNRNSHPKTCLKSCWWQSDSHARVERQLRLAAAVFVGFEMVEVAGLTEPERAPSITPPVRTVVLPPS